MAAKKVFMKDTAGKRERAGISTTYTYNSETMTLRVLWKQETVILKGITEGEPVWINCGGSIPEVRRAKLPRRNADCLMWLLDFPKGSRVHSEKEYNNLLERKRETYSWWNYREFTRKGSGWAITLCNRSDCGGVHHIACMISDDTAANKEAIKEILRAWSNLRWMYYPKSFVASVLRDRFNFTEADLNEISDCLGS